MMLGLLVMWFLLSLRFGDPLLLTISKLIGMHPLIQGEIVLALV
jgi:hypothetical protein